MTQPQPDLPISGPHRFLRRAATVLGLGAFTALGLFLSSLYDVRIAIHPSSAFATGDPDAYVPVHRLQEGPELVLTFIGSPTCPWSTDRRLPLAVETLKRTYAEFARENGLGFRAVVVVVDWTTAQGQGFLSEFGRFDEVSIGRNWANSTLMRYGWEAGIHPVTPTVVIHSQYLSVGEGAEGVFEVGREVLLHRSGLTDLLQFSKLDPVRVLAGFSPAEPAGRSERIPLPDALATDS